MITTNLITFELSFKNSNETIIFNTSRNSLLMVAEFLTSYKKANTTPLLIGKVKEYCKAQSKFKSVARQRLVNCTDFVTDLNIILTNNK
jgi:hypothetical protein